MPKYYPPVYGFLLNREGIIREAIRQNWATPDQVGTGMQRLMFADNTAQRMFVAKAVEFGIRSDLVTVKRVKRVSGPDGDLNLFLCIGSKEEGWEDYYNIPTDEVIEEFKKAVGLKRGPQWARLYT